MRVKTIIGAILLLWGVTTSAQKIKDFYYVEPETKNLPVFIRGNLEHKKILLFVQGGNADNGIDFGRSDYPNWKKTLETKIAIAYFDQRGLNRSVKKIDTSKINATQVLRDIITIARSLKDRYNSEIYLFGHSAGGVKVLECLANFSKATSFIKGGIAFNTPITTDFSPERYNYYRPLYLKNLATEFISQGKDKTYWEGAYKWMVETDSISSIESSKQWNLYVDRAFQPTKRNIGIGMVFRTIFSRPYNPIKYLKNKDNKFIADKLWYTEKALWDKEEQTTLWSGLPNSKHPVLLLTGRYDAIAKQKEKTEAHKLIENSELIILQNCAHESFLDQPEEFNKSIINFLKLK